MESAAVKTQIIAVSHKKSVEVIKSPHSSRNRHKIEKFLLNEPHSKFTFFFNFNLHLFENVYLLGDAGNKKVFVSHL